MGQWYIDNVRIFVTDISEGNKSSVAILNPLGGGSIHQFWGWEEETFGLKALVVGSGDKSSLTSLSRDGDAHTLTGVNFFVDDYNFSKVVYIKEIKWEFMRSICQTLRSDLPENSAVYLANIDLSTEEYPD
jgi:hypothetical protein